MFNQNSMVKTRRNVNLIQNNVADAKFEKKF